jgi:hypothetical protein
MPDLLIIKFAPYSDEMFYPWEQHPVVREELTSHLYKCRQCECTRVSVFESATHQTKVTVRCQDGRDVCERLLAERPNWKSWKV